MRPRLHSLTHLRKKSLGEGWGSGEGVTRVKHVDFGRGLINAANVSKLDIDRGACERHFNKIVSRSKGVGVGVGSGSGAKGKVTHVEHVEFERGLINAAIKTKTRRVTPPPRVLELDWGHLILCGNAAHPTTHGNFGHLITHGNVGHSIRMAMLVTTSHMAMLVTLSHMAMLATPSSPPHLNQWSARCAHGPVCPREDLCQD